MTEKDVRMSQKELIRIHVIHQVLDKQLAQVVAAQKLDLSDRQIRRIVKRVRGEGNQGIIHKSRGKPGNRKIHVAVKERVINLCREKYHGFGPTFACEKLFENEGIHVSDETLRGWLVKEELWLARRQRKKYRQWRERKHCFGEMVQIDGSHHRWLEDRGPLCVLMGYIDDATSKKWGRFYAYEGTVPALDSLRRYIRKNVYLKASMWINTAHINRRLSKV
ncbi:MAG: helix-turn-helix domain-containing protein [Candidatus Omnitrophota bacterium]|nr:helix-turn-helix domain-containing protein [Candidatus Omnitrophota bacterium]